MSDKQKTQILITSAQAAERFNVTNAYVAQLCSAGKVEGVKIDNVWYVHDDGLKNFLSEASFTKAPSYFWVRPDARVVLAGVATGWLVICAGAVSAQVAALAGSNHAPVITLQSAYQSAEPTPDLLTLAAGAATAQLATPHYSGVFSPIVPMGPLLGAPSVTLQDVEIYTQAFGSSLGETVATAWPNSFGTVGAAVVKSTNELAVAFNTAAQNELNTASVWGAWTSWLSSRLYPVSNYAVEPTSLSKTSQVVVTSVQTSGVEVKVGEQKPQVFVKQALPQPN